MEKVCHPIKSKDNLLIEIKSILDSFDYNFAFKNCRGINEQQIQKYSDIILVLCSFVNYFPEIKSHIKLIRQEISQNVAKLGHNYSYFNGRTRLIYAFHISDQYLDIEDFSLQIKDLFDENKWNDYVNGLEDNGLINGYAGALISANVLIHAGVLKNGPQWVDFINHQILNNLEPVEKTSCLMNFYKDAHFKIITDLEYGNAGLVWLFSECTNTNSIFPNYFLKQIVEYIKNNWNAVDINWKNHTIKISNFDQQKELCNLIEQNSFIRRKYQLFTKKDIFWNGGLGISFALIRCINSFKDSNLVNEVLSMIISFAKKNTSQFQFVEYKFEWYYLYTQLYQLTKEDEFLTTSNRILESSSDVIVKLKMLAYSIQGFDSDDLITFPMLKKAMFTKGKLSSGSIYVETLNKYYSRTVYLLEKKGLLQILFDKQNEFEAENKHTLFILSKGLLKSVTLNLSNIEKKLIHDCFNYEDFCRKKIQTHNNKLLVKLHNIIQYQQINQYWIMEPNIEGRFQFKICNDVYIRKSQWNWSVFDSQTDLSKFLEDKKNTYTLIKIKPTKEQKIELPISENELLLLELFIEPVSLHTVKEKYLEYFDINSQDSVDIINTFINETFELLLYNRAIIPVTQ